MANLEIINVDAEFIALTISTATFTGTIKDADGNFAERGVILISKTLNEIVDSTLSNATTGAFELSAVGGSHDVFTVLVYGAAGENDKAMGGLTGILS